MSALVANPIFQRHDTGVGHPERAARVESVERELKERGLTKKCVALDGRAATDAELALVHDPAYIQLVRREVEAGRPQLSTGDTSIDIDSFDVSAHATGCLLEAIDTVMAGKAPNAFCLTRPPGHHATPKRGMGFCIFNAVAVAARYAQRKHDLDRVAIVDWDVHHGNGTQDAFYRDPSVFYFSTHQHPWYPGTGAPEETGDGPGEGTTLNAPFPAGTTMESLREAFTNGLVPALDDFRPDLILLSAGFDSRNGDPLGRFRLTDPDFAELTRIVLDLAAKHCENRLVSTLEGGYHLHGLASAAASHLETLLGKA